MGKHLVEIDEQVLAAARVQLGTKTLKDTVDAALRRVAQGGDRRVARAFDKLARAGLADRNDAWR